MHFEGILESAASPARVYQTVTDPNQVASCMPLVSKVEVRSQDEFDATVNVGVSFVRGEFAIHFKTVEKRPESFARMKVHGAGMGSAVDVDISVMISDGKGEGSSTHWGADARVSGKIASLGQRLMEAQAEKIISQFFECFRTKLE